MSVRFDYARYTKKLIRNGIFQDADNYVHSAFRAKIQWVRSLGRNDEPKRVILGCFLASLSLHHFLFYLYA